VIADFICWLLGHCFDEPPRKLGVCDRCRRWIFFR